MIMRTFSINEEGYAVLNGNKLNFRCGSIGAFEIWLIELSLDPSKLQQFYDKVQSRYVILDRETIGERLGNIEALLVDMHSILTEEEPEEQPIDMSLDDDPLSAKQILDEL